jgi:hypothetical protein
MRLDTGAICKRPVLCPECKEEYLFTLRMIADNANLRCFGCGGMINMGSRYYEPLQREVRETLKSIDEVIATIKLRNR